MSSCNYIIAFSWIFLTANLCVCASAFIHSASQYVYVLLLHTGGKVDSFQLWICFDSST